MMGSVFAMQGIGQFAAGILALICTAAWKNQLLTASGPTSCHGACAVAVDQMWRVIIGFGAVPACIALYYRLTIPETPRYTFDVARDVEKAAEDTRAYIEGRAEGRPDEMKRIETYRAAEEGLTTEKASFRDFIRHFSQWRYGKVLLGTAGSWFFLDIAFYGLSLNNPIILADIGFSGGPTLYNVFYNTAVGNIILVCAGAIPGYWVTVATVDTVGRKPIQAAGFLILTILFCVIGFAFHKLSGGALLGLYVLCQFFFNFGPNATTFIVPGECFPTRYRSTAHGISAASGKVGSIVAQVAIGLLRNRDVSPTNTSGWLDHVMEIYALFMLCGFFVTWFIPETKRRTLEDLAGEEPAAAPVTYGNDGDRSSPSGSLEKPAAHAV